MIDAATIKALRAHLAAKHGLTFCDPRDPGVALLREAATLAANAGVRFVGTLAGLPQEILDAAKLDLSRTSIALGKLILLSDAAVAEPIEEIDTTVHESQHGIDTGADGNVFQAGINYAQPELRAQREARAYAAGFFARYLVTGVLFVPETVASRMHAGPYHLGADELTLARGIATSHLATIAAGVCPPITAALDTLAWLRTHAPDTIVAEGWR